MGSLAFDLFSSGEITSAVDGAEPVLVPTQPLIQWVQGTISQGVKWPGQVKLTAHLHLVPR
jgi:hypothetical protein